MEHVEYLNEYGVIVCRGCSVGVRPEHVHSHFKAAPHRLAKAERERLSEHVRQLRSAVGAETEARKLLLPPPHSAPITSLGPPLRGGLGCMLPVEGSDGSSSECGYVLGNEKNMELHCRRVHGWKSQARRGRPRRHALLPGKAERPWRTGLQFQRFYTHGPCSSFFEVNKGKPEACNDNGGRMTEASDVHDRLLEKMQKRRLEKQEAERDQMLIVDETLEPNPWQRRVGVARYFRLNKQLSLAQMRELAYRPLEAVRPDGEPGGGGDEAYISEIHRAFRRLIWRARSNAILEKVGIFALFEVERRVSGEEPNRPFNANIRRDTIRRYRCFWNGMWTFVFRAWRLAPEERPSFIITQSQKQLLADVAEEAEGVVASKQRGTDSYADGGAAPITFELSPKKRQERLQDSILDLVIGLLDQGLKDDPYRSVLISALAVLSIEEDGSFGDLEEFLPRVSSVIKFARLMVVQKAHRSRAKDVESERRLTGSTQEEAEESVVGHVTRVTRMVDRFMIRGPKSKREPKPMDWLVKLRTFGLHIQYTTPVEGQVYWVGDVLHYQSIRFSMDALRRFVNGIVAEMRQMLFEQLLLVRDGRAPGPGASDVEDLATATLPRIDWNWVDNPTEKAVGWSFLKDIRNTFEVDGQQWLARRILQSRTLSKKFVRRSSGEAQWTKRAMEQYKRSADRFLEKLLVCMHFAGGLPARAPEIMSIRHRNTANGGVRNIFIDQGLVVFVTMYHKNYERTGKINPIQRFLPREVGGPLLQYIWLVIPFLESTEAVMADVEGGPAKPCSAFIWGNRSLLEVDEAGSSASSSEGEQDQDRGGDPGEQGSSRKSATKNKKRRERSSRWTPELMRRLVKRDAERLMKVRLGMSTWRQVAPAIPRKYLRHKFQTIPPTGRPSENGQEDEYEQEYEAGIVRESPWDGQGGHGSFTAGMVYGRSIFEAEYECMDIRAQYRAVSEEWHRFLCFPSSIGEVGPPATAPKRGPSGYWERACRETSLERWSRLANIDTRAQLKRLVGPKAEFRSVQEQALGAILQRTSPLLVVMGTGAGKSLCFMLPASCSMGGVTIVIVPLVSLQGDMQRRCEESGIPSIAWNSRRPHDTAPLIFVTPESAMTKSFGGLLTRLTATYQLERIVVDECHVVLDGTKDFRPKLRELGKLALRGVQMIYLTATLPPRDETEFFELMHIENRILTQFRGQTTRKNIRYQVIERDVPPPTYDALGLLIEDCLDEALQELIDQKLAEYPAPAKIIVYCGEIDTAERLAAKLGCAVFHRNVDTRDGKLRRLTEWMGGKGPDADADDRACRVIFASNALGLGVDVPDVRAVFHYGRLRRLKDYGQESGRAGRDGQPSEAIIVKRRSKIPKPQRSIDALGATQSRQFPDLDEYIEGEFCRRKILDLVMDGRTDRAGCESDEERCDRCHGWQAMTAPVETGRRRADVEVAEDEAQLATHQLRRRVERRDASNIEKIERLRDYLEMWAGKCMLCFWRGRECESHGIWDCTAQDVEVALQGMWVMPQEMRKSKSANEFSGCYDCLLPQALCNKWQSRGDIGGWELREESDAECQFPDVVLGAFVCLWVVFHDDVTAAVEGLMDRDGVVSGNKTQRYRWFCKQVRWGDVESNRLCEVLLHIGGDILERDGCGERGRIQTM